MVHEAEQLAANGYTEIQLLGQNVNSYRDPTPASWNFAQVLAAVGQVAGIRRVQVYDFSSARLFPRHRARDRPACDALRPCESAGTIGVKRGLAPHGARLHREQYLERIKNIRASRRDIAVSTDIIVGFPGETEKDFDETLRLLEQVQYDSVFSFKYSPRAGTAAISYEQRRSRSGKVTAPSGLAGNATAHSDAKQRAAYWREEEVLVEGRREKFQQWIGRTTQNRVLNFTVPADLDGEADWIGTYCRVRVTAAGPNSLVGEMTARGPIPEFHPLRILQ